MYSSLSVIVLDASRITPLFCSMSSGVKPHNFKMNCDSSKYISSLSSTCYYSEIRCIALCVLQILGFSVLSIILADLLGNMFT